jgi:hypothetical protein
VACVLNRGNPCWLIQQCECDAEEHGGLAFANALVHHPAKFFYGFPRLSERTRQPIASCVLPMVLHGVRPRGVRSAGVIASKCAALGPGGTLLRKNCLKFISDG